MLGAFKARNGGHFILRYCFVDSGRLENRTQDTKIFEKASQAA